MSILQSIILGLIQGLTEFLPVSSSAHLIIVPWLFGWKEHLLIFDIILHLATFCAIIIYFRKEWLDILREGFLSIRERTLRDSNQGRLFWGIIISSIPGVIFGSLIGNRVEHYLRNPITIAVTLGIFGLVLYISELYGRKDKSLAEVTWQFSLLIGFSQILAFIPGASRSGVTISTALALGMNRESSVRFSFLMSAPIVFTAACYGIGGLGEINKFLSWQALLTGFIVSFLSSIGAIYFLFKYIRKQPFTVFVIYRLAISLFIISALFWRG